LVEDRYLPGASAGVGEVDVEQLLVAQVIMATIEDFEVYCAPTALVVGRLPAATGVAPAGRLAAVPSVLGVAVMPWSEMTTGTNPSKPFTVAAGVPLA
jgi:hypothetical protein